jgi:predicted enzyme related to lactoylglutathione lyase
MFRLGGQDAAAAYTMRKDEAAIAPPHWNLYVTVENADAIAERAAELGGTVFCPPFDVMTHGRMVTIADPTGAVFCAWQPISHIGVGVKEEAGAFCWADLNTLNQPGAMGFYHRLLGWTFLPGDDNYQHIQNGETFIGGIPAASYLDPKLPPYWLVYFQVDDCVAATQKAKDLGASVLAGPYLMDNVGHIAVLADPQGAAFALFQNLTT